MKKDTLLLIDLEKNYNLTEKNKHYIYLNKGNIHLNNCKQVKLKKFLKLRNKIYIDLIQKFKKFIADAPQNKFFLSEMEIFNLRNDRYEFPDRILNFLIIKKIIQKKKIKKIKIISDNESTLKIFDNLKLKIEKKDFSLKSPNISFPNLKVIKFFFKTFFLILFLKFQEKTKNKLDLKKNFYISLYPNKYLYGKENLFETNQNICNFLLSDETHLNFDLKKLLYFAKITHDKNMINMENYIKISDLFFLLFKYILKVITFERLKRIKISFQGLDFENELQNIYIGSYINRSKLEIYSKAIPRFLKNNNVSSINLYLFEYSFGFYLMRNIRKFSNKIKISGFQHGVFSNNLMWFDLVNSLKHRKMYIPDNIYCLNKYSLRDYKSKYKNVRSFIIAKEKIKKNSHFIEKIMIKKNSNKVLVLPGLHDIKDLYFYIKNKSLTQKRKIFYFKLHPKNKFNFTSNIRIKKIVNLEKQIFSNVIISQNSSLPFEFLISNRNFSVIDFDYKQNYISTYLNKNKKINFLKN